MSNIDPNIPRERTIFAPGWNFDDIAKWLNGRTFDIDQDNLGQIVIYTGLYQKADGSLVVQE